MSYNEFDYWKARPFPTSEDDLYLETNRLFIYGCIQKFDKILDVGPGVGRLFPVYKEAGYIRCCDITDHYLPRLATAGKEAGLHFSFDLLTVLYPLPYMDKEFDLVISSQVLLHQRPIHIIPVMKELIRVGKRVAIITWWDPGTPYQEIDIDKDFPTGQFHYDYAKIISDHGWQMGEVRRDHEQSYFMAWGEYGG